jgi:hypothetical protein
MYKAAQERDAQNASQMNDFFESSLLDKAKSMVLSDFTDYTIMTAGMQIGNGPCFLKVIIHNTTVNTSRSTVLHIRENRDARSQL